MTIQKINANLRVVNITIKMIVQLLIADSIINQRYVNLYANIIIISNNVIKLMNAYGILSTKSVHPI